MDNIDRIHWQGKVNDILDTMSAYGMMLDRIDRQTNDIIVDAIKKESIIDISQFDIRLPDNTKVCYVSLDVNGQIAINYSKLSFKNLEPYDKIRISQGVLSKMLEK